MKVLVLGGCGFIGSHVVDHLLLAGYCVRVFDRSMERYRSPLEGVEYRIGNFNDPSQLEEAVQGVDAVCHLISTTVPSVSNLDPVSDIQGNLVNSLRLFDCMRMYGVKRILFLSSGGTVYGNPRYCPIDENHPLSPRCSYGVVKVAIENYLEMYRHLYGFKPVVLRVSNPYGIRQGHFGVQGLIGTLLGKALSGETIEIWGDGSIVRDYLNVSDVARLCVMALESDHCGVFNAGSGEGRSINEILEMIGDVLGKELNVEYKESRPFDVREVILDIRKACQTFGWRPAVSLGDGVKEQFDWLKSLV